MLETERVEVLGSIRKRTFVTSKFHAEVEYTANNKTSCTSRTLNIRVTGVGSTLANYVGY